MLDCIIEGGTVVDGTGRPGVRANVGIQDGKIAAIGEDLGDAARTIDASDRVVAPGFIDMHTHIDAQVMWEPGLTPSSLHGVTTVIGGNCGFAIAPISPASGEYVVHMLSAVEGIPVESLKAGLTPTWTDFADWISRIEGKSALNCGFLAGHSTIRRLVIGEDWKRPATADEVEQMAALVDQTVAAGALGFSSSWNEIHADHEAAPVPSRFAEPEELIRLSSVLQNYPGTTLGFQAGSWPLFTERAITTMGEMSKAAGRPLNWNALTVGTGVSEEAIRQRMTASDYAEKIGGQVFALMFPSAKRNYITPMTSIFFHMLPNWPEVFALSPEKRVEALADPAVRAKLIEGVEVRKHELRANNQFDKMSVANVVDPSLKEFEGRALADIAAEQNITPLEVFFDLSVADKLRIYFLSPDIGNDEDSWRLRAELWNDPRTVIGASDAGAHLDSLDAFTYTTDLVGPSVRDRRLLSLEQAVHLLTQAPAKFNSLKGRGVLEAGYWADVVIFDPATVRPDVTKMIADMPAGQKRIFAEAIGIDRVMVNGTEVVVDRKVTGAVPGHLILSNRDLETA
jgi:N-acyl-D-aspartate/D-glutamate deacylase